MFGKQKKAKKPAVKSRYKKPVKIKKPDNPFDTPKRRSYPYRPMKPGMVYDRSTGYYYDERGRIVGGYTPDGKFEPW